MVLMPFHGGLPETHCGPGSTIESTEDIRRVLPSIISELGIKTMLDAPCGDCNWVSQVDLDVDYTGMDYDHEHLSWSKTRMKGTFVKGNIVEDELPAADLMLCRDFLQHLPNDQVSTVLGKIKAKWLLATSHNVPVNSDLWKAGGFRPLNLCAAPFSLPPPDRSYRDGIGRILGLWKWA